MRGKKALTDIQVEVIKEMIRDGVTLKEIQLAFGINRNILHAISANNSYKDVGGEVPSRKHNATGPPPKSSYWINTQRRKAKVKTCTEAKGN